MGDAALVEAALADPRAGFGEIYDAYGDRLYDYCYGILRSTADASDAVQDTFLAALDKLPQLRDPDKLRPWLYAIARSQCFRRTRGRQRERVSDTAGDTVIGDEDVDSSIETDHLPALVWDAVAGLSEVDRAVIDLNVRHELEGEELAASLGVPASKAYVMLHRAKGRLETSIGALLVARAGTDSCADLAQIVAGSDFTPLIRKRVARHIDGCAICEDTRSRNRPEALLALVPLLGAPEGLREQILTAVGSAAGPVDVGSAGIDSAGATASTPSPDGGWRSGRAPTPEAAAGSLEWDHAGFPNPIEASRAVAWLPTAIGGALAAALLLIAGFVLIDRDDDGVVEVAGPAETTTIEATTEPPVTVLGTTEVATTDTEVPPSTALAPAPGSQPDDAPAISNPAAAATTSEQPAASAPPATTGAPSTTASSSTAAPTTSSSTTTSSNTTTASTTSSSTTPSSTTSSTTTTTTTTEAPDTTAPVVSGVTADCATDAFLSIMVTDDRGLGPVSIRASWPDDQAFFSDAGGGLYTLQIRAADLPANPFTFTVTGTVEDLAGNMTAVSDSAPCTPPDVTPPQVSGLRVVCGGTVRLSVDIIDDRTEKFTIDITASWPGGSADFARLAGSTYGVDIPSNSLPEGTVRFTVTGTVADLAGNTTNVSRTGSCQIFN